MSLQSSDGSDELSTEVENWADSCLVFSDDDSWTNLSKELLDALMKEDSNLGEKSGEIFLSPSSESKHVPPAAQQPSSSDELFLLPSSESKHVSPAAQQPSSSGKPSAQSGPELRDIDENDEVGFNYEKTDDATRIRYKGEEYVLFTDSVPTEKDEDLNLVEVGETALLENLESKEQIFKVWDLGKLEDEEEDELTLELKKALGEYNVGTSHTRRSTEDQTVALNMQELDDLINGITDLSLGETPSSPPHSPARRPGIP